MKRRIRDNVYCRCGHAVSRLFEIGLLARPDWITSEDEVREWWLVSRELAARLAAAGQPVVRFCELSMWGRSTTGVAPEDDLALHALIGT
jgi:hypothetical protein